MAQPRRAAEEPLELSVDAPVAPRRSRGMAPFMRRSVPPVAVVGLLTVTTVLTFVPPSDPPTSTAHPQRNAVADLGVSRNQTRPELSARAQSSAAPTRSASPSPAPAPVSASPVATASVTPSATPTSVATPTAASSRSATPSVRVPALADKVGTRYASSPLNVRRGPGVDFDVITTVAAGRAVTITEATQAGWQQIVLDGKAAWVKASYLTSRSPATTKASAPTSPSTKASSSRPSTTPEREESVSTGGFDTSPCAKVSGIEGGLTSRADKVARVVCNLFPGVSSFGGRRPGDSGLHGSGRAVDVMVSGEYGWEIARWARANARALGITEVIYQQKIWTTQRSGDGWRGMSDRGSASANHYDHVHISVG